MSLVVSGLAKSWSFSSLSFNDDWLLLSIFRRFSLYRTGRVCTLLGLRAYGLDQLKVNTQTDGRQSINCLVSSLTELHVPPTSNNKVTVWLSAFIIHYSQTHASRWQTSSQSKCHNETNEKKNFDCIGFPYSQRGVDAGSLSSYPLLSLSWCREYPTPRQTGTTHLVRLNRNILWFILPRRIWNQLSRTVW